MSSPTQFIDNRKYYKSNFDQALRYTIPSIYFEEDELLVSGLGELDIIDQVVNSQVSILANFSSIINIPLTYLTQTVFSSINSPSTMAQYFIKQNDLFDIEPIEFERQILNALSGDSYKGKSFNQFETSADFSYYVTNELLPGIKLGSPSISFGNLSNQDDRSAYLIETIPWLYFLNLPYRPCYNSSAYVHDLIVGKLYAGQPIHLVDAMKGVTEYIWRNYTTSTTWQSKGFIPKAFEPDLTTVDPFTSSTAKLDALKTLIDIVYSPLYSDRGDIRVQTAIQDYLDSNIRITQKVKHGPFTRLMKAFSFGFADYDSNVEKLKILDDINKCPSEYLPYLADLIGWKLFGSDPDRWRLQIVNAVDVYKRIGTKKSIQYAINSVFPNGQFDVSSRISELWESYVPFLIYYSLATESTMLSSFDTWTRDLALKLQVSSYNFSSIDENVKLVVDQIMYELAKEYPSNFIVANNPEYYDTESFVASFSKFPIGTSSFVFNYRGRKFPVPPFEEYPYYANTILTNDLITTIADKLVCFGVPNSFAFKVSDFIRDNSVLAQDDIRSDNRFLLFTSAAQYPPNWSDIIKDISNRKVEYFPLWNSKSSHFNVVFHSNEFDFTKNSLETDSREAFGIVADIIKEFSPAHSIPNITADLSSADTDEFVNIILPYVGADKLEFTQVNYSSGTSVAGFVGSGLLMDTYKRGIATGKPPFKRWQADSIIDPLLAASGTLAYLPRRNHRRRSFKFTLPKDGFYDRTGFNMPVTMDVSTVEISLPSSLGFLPLGLIPSSQQYVPIPDYKNIPAIYDRCENLTSKNYYSGLWVSNTFPCRGWRRVESNGKYPQQGSRPDYYHDLNQLHPLIAVMHYIKEKKKLYDASTYYYNNPDYLYENSYWKNVIQSYANSSTELSGNFPNSFEDYTNFEFGRDFHKFYSDYRKNFSSGTVPGRLIPNVLYLDGPTIFGHTFGSIFKNSKLNENGSLTKVRTDLIVSSLDYVPVFYNGTGVFSNSGVSYSGTFIASSLSSITIEGFEYRNSGILDHIELCQSVSSGQNNSFTIYRLDKNQKDPRKINPLLYNNTLIKQTSKNGFGRIRFDLSRYTCLGSELYDTSTNFLTPEHNFKLTFKTLISNTDGDLLGDGAVGVWIHTQEEDGNIWSYSKDGKWVQHSASAITILDLVTKFANLSTFVPGRRGPVLKCAKYIDKSDPNRSNQLLNSFSDDEFQTIEINFNTRNRALCEDPETQLIVPNQYYKNVSSKVHRLNQKYVVEVFTLPSTKDNFTLFYDFNMLDTTLNAWSKPLVGGIRNKKPIGDIYCPEFRIDLTREQVLTIIKYFNELAGVYNNFGYASRIATQTSGIYETSGGSRLNYVDNPDWNTSVSKYATGLHSLLSIIN